MPPISLERAMRLRGLTLDDLARKTGLTRTTLWRTKQGLTRPYAGNARKIAEVLGLSIADVVELNGGDDEPTSPLPETHAG